jgi:peptide/nickel transport system substrate-binding protein
LEQVRKWRGRGIILGLATLALVTAACGSSKKNAAGPSTTGTPTSAAVKQGGTLNYGADQEPTGFNNATSKDHGTSVTNVMAKVWPSFFHVTPQFTIIPDKDLIVSADVTNQNPQTVVIKINPNAVWSDGVPIDAEDFIYNWEMQKDPNNTKDSCTNGCAQNGKAIDDATDGTGYNQISSITGSDNNKTVTMVFSKPFADWKSLWTAGGGSAVVPAHIAKKVGWNDGFDKFDPNVVVSGGPFKIQSYNSGKDLTLVPNEKYWGAKPHLDSIVFHFISDSSQQVPALQNKEVDMIYPQPQLDAVNAVKNIGDVNPELNFGLSFEHIDFNTKTPGLDDINVRKAIATAIDRPTLVQRTVGQFSSKAVVNNNRMYVNNQPQYKDTSGGLYDKGDPAKAKQMLEAAGYTLGGDGIYAKGTQKLNFRITTTAGNALRESSEALMQAQLKAAGIGLNIVNLKSTDYFGKALPQHNFDIGLFAWVSSPFPSGNNPEYTVGAGQNYGQFGNAQMDQLLNAGAAELDTQKQTDDYNQADKIMWDNMWTLPLYQKPTYIAYRNTFVNVHDNSSQEGPFWNAETWGLK